MEMLTQFGFMNFKIIKIRNRKLFEIKEIKQPIQNYLFTCKMHSPFPKELRFCTDAKIESVINENMDKFTFFLNGL